VARRQRQECHSQACYPWSMIGQWTVAVWNRAACLQPDPLQGRVSHSRQQWDLHHYIPFEGWQQQKGWTE
jgi:hypothetical protein